MPDIFHSGDFVTPDVDEDSAALLGWLNDLWQQADLMEATTTHAETRKCCDILKSRIAALGAVILAK